MKRTLMVASLLSTVLFAQTAPGPALLTIGDAPPLPVHHITGGQVLVEATVNRAGSISGVSTLRTMQPFGDLVMGAVSGWRFSPAQGVLADGTIGPIESRVLVAAVFRAPVLMDGPKIGALPKDTAAPSPQVPFPTVIVEPPFPPLALQGDVVMLEVQVGLDGSVGKTRIIRSGPGFDEAATDAVHQWKFRPARIRGTPVPSVAYVIFGFSQPIIITEPDRRP